MNIVNDSNALWGAILIFAIGALVLALCFFYEDLWELIKSAFWERED